MKNLLCFGVLAGALIFPLGAQTTVTTTTTTTTPVATSSATAAVNVARDGVDEALRERLVSVYGVGTPAGIQTWWVIFFDPSVPSRGHAVKVENGAITKSYEAKGGVVYSGRLTFPRSSLVDEGPALATTQNYAAKHAIAYDQVRVLLRNTTKSPSFRWRVEMFDGPTSKGFVFVNVSDGSFAMYAPPGSVPTTSAAQGGLVGDAKKVGDDVKNTFLGIGGDLQEFFTGERTVDH